jgi:hypothetical protein
VQGTTDAEDLLSRCIHGYAGLLAQQAFIASDIHLQCGMANAVIAAWCAPGAVRPFGRSLEQHST